REIPETREGVRGRRAFRSEDLLVDVERALKIGTRGVNLLALAKQRAHVQQRHRNAPVRSFRADVVNRDGFLVRVTRAGEIAAPMQHRREVVVQQGKGGAFWVRTLLNPDRAPDHVGYAF